MIQSTSHPSSSHGSDSSNAIQGTPNTDIYRGQFPWLQPAYIHPYYSYGVPHNGTHDAAHLDAPVASSPGVGVEIAHPAFQAGPCDCYPPAAAHVSGAPPYPPLTAAATSPQHPSVSPLYHQPFPPNSFPGATIPYPPGIEYFHQHHVAGLATGSTSSFLPQAPSFLAGQKHIAEDIEDRNVKRIKMGIKNDPFFTPVLDQYGQYNGTYICSKDGKVIRPHSYQRHIKTTSHRGYKLTPFKCPLCLRTYSRRDTCERHWDTRCGLLMVGVDGAPLSYSAACQGSISSASASPAGVPTAAFMFPLPTTATTSDSSPSENTPTEAAEDAPNPDSLAANNIQDPALVAPVLPPSEVRDVTLAEGHNSSAVNEIRDPVLAAPSSGTREITLSEVRGNLGFWKWINGIEDSVDAALPIPEPSSSLLPETILADAAEDPDAWMLMNEIEDFVYPELPLCESPADAAEDPDFCNFPIRTLLICSWLNNSYGGALQRSPSELVPLSSTLIDHEM